MTMKEELEELARRAGELAQQALKGEGDLATAQLLAAQLENAREAAQASPVLWLKWQEAHRYLDVAMAAMRPQEETAVEKVFRLSQMAFQLAQSVASGHVESGIHEQAREIDGQLKTITLASLAPSDRLTLERTISEAQLDLLYVLADGNAPTSIRLFHFLQAQPTNE
jgi:pyridoxal/pyridoxine/pyridoxamine kinase